MIISSRSRSALSWPAVTAAAAATVGGLAGGLAALHYHRLGLTLSHYDARGHLIVARRITDSITPGWQQVGAVWLPLPHLLNLLPVQVLALYRSGASAVAISVAAFAAATGAIAWTVLALTGSRLAASLAAFVFVLNPNMLYVQATPLTEPLLLALTVTAVARLMAWCEEPSGTLAGWLFALACLTRYEAWSATACALALACWARMRHGDPLHIAIRRVGRIAAYPSVAIVSFVLFSRIVVGSWFVSSGFFVPENKALGAPVLAAAEIWWGVRRLSGDPLALIGLAGLGMLLVLSFRRERAGAVVPLSMLAFAFVPWAAFVKGHPFRIRYIIPLEAVEAMGTGMAAGLIKPLRAPMAVLILAFAAFELRPFDPAAPMVLEAQWDQPNRIVRRTITDCLRAGYRGDKVMASMGSLGHYMQEASRSGFEVRDFLHEGNGDLWLAALDGPRPFAGWVLIEETANGGDVLARIARRNPRFLGGYTRVCEGAGMALYRRTEK